LTSDEKFGIINAVNKMEKATHFEVLKVGASPEKRFLQKTMNGVLWTSQGFAHKFLSLDLAVEEANKHENVVVIWVDETLASDFPCWGEVNHSNVPLATYQFNH